MIGMDMIGLDKFPRLIRTKWQIAAAGLLVFLMAATIYRAATQSVSHDEGLVYEWFETGPWSQLFGSEFGNHHPLTVLLSRLSVTIFGLSEFSLRLPSVIGSALYLYAIYRICGFLLGEGALFLLGVAFLTANPFVLDYLCLSRGYSLGLALFIYAVYPMMLYLSANHGGQNPNRLLNRAGIALGLSIGCNVIMIFPAIPLALAFFTLLIADWILTKPVTAEIPIAAEERRKKKKERKRQARSGAAFNLSRSAWQAMTHLALPACLVAGLIVMLPRKLVYFEEGYLGPPSLFAILEGIVRPSLLHSASGVQGLAAFVPSGLMVGAVTYFAVPVLILALSFFTLVTIFRWVRGKPFDELPDIDRFLLLFGVTIPAVLLLIVASRYIFDKPYPEMRTVLYWIPVLGLVGLALIHKMFSGSRIGRWGAASGAALLVLCVVQFATQFNTRYFAEWAYCAATRDMMSIIRAQHSAHPERRVRVGASWELEPGINFYRVMWRMTWMDPVFREGPDSNYDYYMLLRDHIQLIERRRLKPLLRDTLSNTALAQAAL
jgi:hypothetical protein